MAIEKEISYTATNTYTTLNSLSETTKNVWLVCHGLGYLSRYFMKYFKSLNPEENYIIAPQAPSKFYLNGEFKHVGASWLTKENTLAESENILRYLDAVYQAENIPEDKNLFVMGYSQGVSVALRWVAKRAVLCKKIIIHSGGIPKELETNSFDFLPEATKVYHIYGVKDQYLTEERMAYEKERAATLFNTKVTTLAFDGTHEVNTAILSTISEEI
jgi:predicted esterase